MKIPLKAECKDENKEEEHMSCLLDLLPPSLR